MSILQETAKKSTISPIFQPELTEIRGKLAEWDEQCGGAIVSRWLFDIAFSRLYQANGFEFAGKLLTQTRHALKKSEKNKKVTYPISCVGERQPDSWRKASKRTLRKIDAKARQKRLHAKQDKIRIEERITRGAGL